MNSRNVVNDTSLVNFPTDLSALDQLDSKEGILSFPFDHIYACHTDTTQLSSSGLRVDKDDVISGRGVGNPKNIFVRNEISTLTENLNGSRNENRQLKELLLLHLDLIQQQSEQILNKEKLLLSLKQENETLKLRLERMDRRVSLQRNNQTSIQNPPPLIHLPPSSQHTIKPLMQTTTSTPQISVSNFADLLVSGEQQNPFLFDTNLIKEETTIAPESFIDRVHDDKVADDFLPELNVATLLGSGITTYSFGNTSQETTAYPNQTITSKSLSSTSTLGTMTGNSYNRSMPRNGRMNQIYKSRGMPRTEKKPPLGRIFNSSVTPKSLDNTFSVNKKSKMIHTYGKSSRNTSTKQPKYMQQAHTESKHADTLAVDPYQLLTDSDSLGETIPKLTLHRTNKNKSKTSSKFGNADNVMQNFFDSSIIGENSSGKAINKIKLNKFNLETQLHTDDLKKDDILDIAKGKSYLLDSDPFKSTSFPDWSDCLVKKESIETSCRDFSYGETVRNLSTHILPSFDNNDFKNIFESDSSLSQCATTAADLLLGSTSVLKEERPLPKKKQRVRTSSLLSSVGQSGGSNKSNASGNVNTRRKRALSNCSSLIPHTLSTETGQGTVRKSSGLNLAPGERVEHGLFKGKVMPTGKKSPPPPLTVNEPYYTSVGDPESWWYSGQEIGCDPEEISCASPVPSSVPSLEVPRWRERPCTSCYSLEGTENLDDEVFNKRHHKQEADERRRKRWDVQRIREQRHVERLRRRQRDGVWGPPAGLNGLANTPPITFLPQPHRDARYIEITESVPVSAFGEILPALPECEFMLPWVGTSKPSKRSKHGMGSKRLKKSR